MKAGIPSMYIPICSIASAGFLALAVVVFLLYFFIRFCCGKCGCFWYFLNVLMYFSIIVEIVTYILGIQSVPERNFKCSKGLTNCYYGIYNKTLGKLNYDRSEEYNQKLWDEWEEFQNWYKNVNDDDICNNTLKTPLIVGIFLFICYIFLLFVLGGCKCITDKLCCCCCCCNCFKSKDNSSNEDDAEDYL